MADDNVRSDWMDDAKLIEGPRLVYDADRVRAFDALIGEPAAHAGRPLDYRLPYPKYEFLCFLADCRGYVLHGSNAADIDVFEPRMQPDALGRPRQCVYATPDGIWPMYFALINRARYRGSLRNRFQRLADEDGTVRRYYRFSINQATAPRQRWRPGTIYVLPRDTFTPTVDGLGRATEEWASSLAVRPVASISVDLSDFPFQDRVELHDDSLAERLTELQMRVLAAYDRTERQEEQTLIRLQDRKGVAQDAEELVRLIHELDALSDVSLDFVDDNGPALAARGESARPLIETIERLAPKLRAVGRIPGLLRLLLLVWRLSRGPVAGLLQRRLSR